MISKGCFSVGSFCMAQNRIVSACSCLLMLSIVCSSWAETYYVDDDAAAGGDGLQWSSAFNNIQDAVDAASLAQGGDVWVAQGTYTSYGAHVVQLLSNVSLYGGFSGDEQQLSDRQLGASPSIIDGESDRRCVNANNVTDAAIDGFVITNGLTTEDGGAGMRLSSSSTEIRNCQFVNNKVNGIHELCYGGGIYNWYSSPTVINCTFENNSVQYYGGGGIFNIGSSPIITNCFFDGNNAPGHGAGLYNTENSSPTITNCIWTTNTTIGYGGGVFNNDGSSPTITNCSFNGNNADLGGEGVYSKSDCSPVMTNCIIWGENAGIVDEESTSTVTYSCVKGGFAGVGNIDLDPMFADDELHLSSISPCIDTGTEVNAPETDINGVLRPQGSGYDMGAYELSLYYVDDNAAPGGDGLAWETAFSSIQDAVDAAHGVGGGEVWVAEGVYIASAAGDSVVVVESGVSLYGGFSGNETSLVQRDWIDNQTIIDGQDNYRGLLFDMIDDVIMDGFTITNCFSEQGGGMSISGYKLAIRNCMFVDNEAYSTGASGSGGGIGNAGTTHLELADCIFLGNKASNGGGGMANSSDYSPTIINCRFEYNVAPYGGGVANSFASPTFINCLFVHNTADVGGGMHNIANSIPMLMNCTLMGNVAGQGGGIHNRFSTATKLTNCILWGNGGEIADSGTLDVTYSCIQNGYPGEGNVDADPQFWNPAEGDLRLLSTSPCIDAGTSEDAPEEDIRGELRPFGPGYDMGAYEWSNLLPNIAEVLLGMVPANPTMDTNSDGLIDAADLIIN